MDKTYTVEVHHFQDPEDGVWVAEAPALSCATQADTEEEVICNIKEAILCCLESLEKMGVDIPVESDQEKQEKQGYKKYVEEISVKLQ